MSINPFLEERLAVSAKMGALYADEYKVEITRTSNDAEYRRLIHPFPIRYYNFSFALISPALREQIAGLYHRAYGMFAGFRVKNLDDYTTGALNAVPTAFDQPLAVLTAGSSYQLQKQYGAGGTPISIGLPVRTIFKPVSGTTKIGIRNATTGDHQITAWAVDTTTGIVTMSANKTKAITAITQAASAVITVGASHGFVVGDSVHISGVAGMTQINGRRASVTAIGGSTITVGINSSAFSAYTSGGTVNTRPQTGEVVYGGCEFDLPCRFNSRIDYTHISTDIRETGDVEIVELIAL